MIDDILNKKEALNPELTDYIEEGSFSQCIRHPLLYHLFYNEAMNALINAQFKAKKEAIERATNNKNWSQIIWLYERPYRLMAFHSIESRLTDGEYWKILGSIWTDSENIWQNYDAWLSLLTKRKRNLSVRYLLMNEKERDRFFVLPNEITIYRGCMVKNKNGLSWTTDKERAVWFAHRFYKSGTTPILIKATVLKKDIIAFFTRRSEDEIVVLPSRIKIKGIKYLTSEDEACE